MKTELLISGNESLASGNGVGRASTATKKLRVLIVGTGSIGERHLRCFSATGRVTTGVMEINPRLRKAMAERYAVARTFSDLDAAIESGFDAAVVATPAPLHVPIAKRLAEAGIHLLIEKPLSTHFTGIDELEATVERRGVVAAVAYVYRAHSALAAMRNAILEGRFGQPRQIVATCGQHFPTYRPAYRQTYYVDHAAGGGAIQDAMTHVLNAGEWLVGPTTKIFADAGHQVLDGVDVEDTVHLVTRHGNVMGCYALNQHQAPNEVTITVACTRGTARWEMHTGNWQWMTTPGGNWETGSSIVLERDTLFTLQARAFLDAVEGHGKPLCSLQEGIATLLANLAALSSAASPAWQPMEGACRQFRDATE